MNAPPPDYPPGVRLEDRPCPNGCQQDDELLLQGHDRIHGLPGVFRVVRCRHCDLLRTNPRPTADTIGAYYPSDYAPYLKAAGRQKKVRRFRHRVKDSVRRWFGRDTRRLPPIAPGHALEIGCADGSYLLELRDIGWSVEGVEFSDVAAGRARLAGLHVQTGSVETVAAPLQQADMVMGWMVLEHLHEPIHALRRVRQWVKPGGYLVGVVPDADAFDRKLFGEYWYALHLPAHLYHYTPDTLRRVLAAAGWELVRVRWQPNPNNLLNTLHHWAQERQHPRWLAFVRWLRDAKRSSSLRRWLGWWLGLTRQSGRMEFWAKPSPQERP